MEILYVLLNKCATTLFNFYEAWKLTTLLPILIASRKLDLRIYLAT